MAVLYEKIPKPSSPKILEVLAAQRAVHFILELGFEQSIFEGDSEVIIKALVDGNFSIPSIGHIVKDIMSMTGLLPTKSFSHIRRQGNMVAHALTQRARLFFPILVWMENVSLDINRFVFVDFLVIQ